MILESRLRDVEAALNPGSGGLLANLWAISQGQHTDLSKKRRSGALQWCMVVTALTVPSATLYWFDEADLMQGSETFPGDLAFAFASDAVTGTGTFYQDYDNAATVWCALYENAGNYVTDPAGLDPCGSTNL